jgi:hypothetical protein
MYAYFIVYSLSPFPSQQGSITFPPCISFVSSTWDEEGRQEKSMGFCEIRISLKKGFREGLHKIRVLDRNAF